MRRNKHRRITSLHKKGEGVGWNRFQNGTQATAVSYATHRNVNFLRFFAQSSKYKSISF
jgi:hypothetical protein